MARILLLVSCGKNHIGQPASQVFSRTRFTGLEARSERDPWAQLPKQSLRCRSSCSVGFRRGYEMFLCCSLQYLVSGPSKTCRNIDKSAAFAFQLRHLAFVASEASQEAQSPRSLPPQGHPRLPIRCWRASQVAKRPLFGSHDYVSQVTQPRLHSRGYAAKLTLPG